MKKISCVVFLTILFLSGCNQKPKEDAGDTQNIESAAGDTISSDVEPTDGTDAAGTYACSMHPEITGAKNDKCSECGMALTELVAED